MASNIRLADCIVQAEPQKCWTCANAYGGCPWTEVDERTGKVKFEPIPGWTAKRYRKRMNPDRRQKYDYVYAIKDCPMYEEE